MIKHWIKTSLRPGVRGWIKKHPRIQRWLDRKTWAWVKDFPVTFSLPFSFVQGVVVASIPITFGKASKNWLWYFAFGAFIVITVLLGWWKERSSAFFKSELKRLHLGEQKILRSAEKAQEESRISTDLLKSLDKIVNEKSTRFTQNIYREFENLKDFLLRVGNPTHQLKTAAEQLSAWLYNTLGQSQDFKVAIASFDSSLKMEGIIASSHPCTLERKDYAASFFSHVAQLEHTNEDHIEDIEDAIKKGDKRYVGTGFGNDHGSVWGFQVAIPDIALVFVVTIKSSKGIIHRKFIDKYRPMVNYYKTRMLFEGNVLSMINHNPNPQREGTHA